ncbi:hypothetical protein CTAYLR_006800 [Chrysophaeum taylorii]|uniref:Right handed beta helix domain-containing protein n=1 Tax=Chrysophaeum taylorii TaxID=2483200 RepID=A0AAD7XKA0_9STRA|nr:hypothetical protein CTAYLR_006800 [Chrysophaeum taylorii]
MSGAEFAVPLLVAHKASLWEKRVAIGTGLVGVLVVGGAVTWGRPGPANAKDHDPFQGTLLPFVHVDARFGLDSDACGAERSPCQSLGWATTRGVAVSVACGRYELGDPLRLRSGQRLVGDASCETCISGGIEVSGAWSDGAWTGTLPDGSRTPLMVTADEAPTRRARTPVRLFADYDTEEGSWVEWDEIDDAVFSPLRVRPGMMLCVFDEWTAPRLGVTKIERDERKIYVEPRIRGVPRGRFFVDGVDATSPSTTEVETPTWSVDGSSLAIVSSEPIGGPVIAHQLVELVVLEDVADVAIENVVFEHADVDVSCLDVAPTYCDFQAASFLETAAFRIENATRVSLTDVTIRHVGGYALWVGKNASDVEISRLRATDLGAGAVRVGAPNHGMVNHWQAARDVAVLSSDLTDGGTWWMEGVGVLVQQASRVAVLDNRVERFRYTGISVGWTWDWSETPPAYHLIANNYVSDISMKTLSDLGGIYALGNLRGTVVSNNTIKNVDSYDYSANHGIYLDQATSHARFEYNLVHHIQCDGIFVHWGVNNTLDNNVLADLNPQNQSDCVQYGAVRTSLVSGGCDTSNGDTLSCVDFRFTRNIVYVDFVNDHQPTIYGLTPYVNSTFDHNVYFNRANLSLHFPPNNEPFAAWQTTYSHDLHSLVADPRFVDPATCDYRLSSDSPARDLGIASLEVPGRC